MLFGLQPPKLSQMLFFVSYLLRYFDMAMENLLIHFVLGFINNQVGWLRKVSRGRVTYPTW